MVLSTTESISLYPFATAEKIPEDSDCVDDSAADSTLDMTDLVFAATLPLIWLAISP